MLLLICISASAYSGRNLLANNFFEGILASPSADPLRVAIECANSSKARDVIGDDPVYAMKDLFEAHGFVATIVNGSNIDTLEELNNFDVVVIGDSGWDEDDFSVFQTALKAWVQNGG
jgi:hypothetical protein